MEYSEGNCVKYESFLNVSLSRAGKDALKTLVPLLAIFLIGPLFYTNQFFFFLMGVLIISTNALNIVYGYTGYLPFGFGLFLAFGAYLASMSINLIHIPVALSIIIGGLSSVLLSLVFSPLLRLSGAYFAIASLATFESLYYIMSNLSLASYTGGPYGISVHAAFTPNIDYYAIAAVAVMSSLIILYIHHSNFGLALKAMNDDRHSVEMCGVNSHRFRTYAWIISTFLVGVTGGLYAIYLGFFYPSGVFDLTEFSVLVIIFLIFGGRGTYLGPLIGSVVLFIVYQEVTLNYPNYSLLVFGILIVGLILFMPNGVVGILKKNTKEVF